MLTRLMFSGGGGKPLAVITFIPEEYITGGVSNRKRYIGAIPGERGTLSPKEFNIKGLVYGFEWIRERISSMYPSDFRLYQGGSLSYNKHIVMRINGIDYTIKANARTSAESPYIGFTAGTKYTIEIFDII